MKLAVVGGGSTYTPELVDGLGRLRDVLPVDELVLVDPSAERLELVGGRRAADPRAARATRPARHVDHDLEPALDGVDAVLLQLRVGGQAARNQDETWPLECGCVGQETTGAGGLAKALRTVPVVLDIAEQVRKAAPDAWIIDFTNPVGIVTRALLQAGHRAVGLCNVAIGFQRRFAASLGVRAGVAGARPRRAQPPDVGAGRVGRRRGPAAGAAGSRTSRRSPSSVGLPAELLRSLGVVPSYYLRYFYAHDEVVREQLAAPSRAAEVAEIERKLLELYADPALDEKPELLGAARRGVLLRGRGAAGRGAAGRRADVDARGEPAQRRHLALPARRRGDRGAGPRRPLRRCGPSSWTRSSRCTPGWSRT